ncbi:hypothetical protein [Sphingomonas xinjiangensis]|uniref:Uncharacterized protein n=1 Tax=Sphingomonas xinjiangensis TaxID=643568 RepID=A0A840YT49_9SPHN|nr:hypothetical protein [Sphingomonas xinjiangensis]MBB5712827.1 hypothetical protein [Sphingomonas xinjiangensis]
MQVSLFRALKSINIDDEIAAKAVEVVEEHIEMSVAGAVKPLENKIDTLVALVGTQNGKIDALATKVESVNLSMQTAVSSMRGDINTLRWLVAATATVIATAGAAVGIVAKLPL